MAQSRTDIQIIRNNPEGEDYSFGDLHGCFNMFQEIVKKLTPADRLFLVGDFIDKGPESENIAQGITKINADRKAKDMPPQIYSIRGNHEEVFLNYCAIKREFEKNPDDPFKQYLEQTTHYAKALGGEWYLTLEDNKLAPLENQFLSLPNLMYIEDAEDPFIIVHAERPITMELFYLKVENETIDLSDSERLYASWARENDPDNPIVVTEKEYTAPISYCGHSINAGVRYQNAHVNLDTGAYFSSYGLLIGHKKKTCEIITTDANNLPTEAKEAKEKIENYFQIRTWLIATDKYLKLQRWQIAQVIKSKDLSLNKKLLPHKSMATIFQQLEAKEEMITKLTEELPALKIQLELYKFFEELYEILVANIASTPEAVQTILRNLLSSQTKLEFLKTHLTPNISTLLQSLGTIGNEILEDLRFSNANVSNNHSTTFSSSTLQTNLIQPRATSPQQSQQI